MAAHTMFDGRLQIYRRADSRFGQSAGGRRFRESTEEESPERAKDVAEAWYLALHGTLRDGTIIPDARAFTILARKT